MDITVSKWCVHCTRLQRPLWGGGGGNAYFTVSSSSDTRPLNCEPRKVLHSRSGAHSKDWTMSSEQIFLSICAELSFQVAQPGRVCVCCHSQWLSCSLEAQSVSSNVSAVNLLQQHIWGSADGRGRVTLPGDERHSKRHDVWVQASNKPRRDDSCRVQVEWTAVLLVVICVWRVKRGKI